MPASAGGPTRREFLHGSSAIAMAATGAPAILTSSVQAASPLPRLTLWGPPAGPSIVLAHAVATRRLRQIAERVEFKAWRNPDEMRAGLASGTMDVVVVPTQVAANLFNRGLGVRLLNTMTDGILYMVAGNASLNSIASLRACKVGVPFRNDTPEFIFNSLLKASGLAAGRDLTVETTGTPIEAMQLLLAGRLDVALLPEPAATAAIVRGKMAGKTIVRVMDVQKLWGVLDPMSHAMLPQAGLAVTDSFRKANPERIDRLHEILTGAAAEVRASPAIAANNAAAQLELPWPIIEQSIPWSNLECRRATAARPYLEAMYTTISEADPALLGGKLPEPDFYL